VVLITKWFHRKKIVVSTHGGIFHTKNISLIKKFYFYVIEKFLLKNADAVIAVSEEDLSLFKKIYPETALIENGFSLPEVKGKKEKNRFLFVGRFSKNKRIDLLIETFSKIAGAKLIIVGNDFDNLEAGLREKAKKSEKGAKIEFKKNLSRKEIIQEYSRAEYFVSASEYEGFGVTAIEAMHCGCICILNKIPTFERFCKNGHGFIVNYSNTKSASEEIKKIMQKNNSDTKTKAQEFSKRFRWERKALEFIEVYKKIA
jgi:alpha-1,3-mannosyltransferase